MQLVYQTLWSNYDQTMSLYLIDLFRKFRRIIVISHMIYSLFSYIRRYTGCIFYTYMLNNGTLQLFKLFIINASRSFNVTRNIFCRSIMFACRMGIY